MPANSASEEVAHAWFVRVQDQEYGPVDLDTLLEWKAEGRLIPENEVRQGPEGRWTAAGDFPELFASADQGGTTDSTPGDVILRRRSLPDVLIETRRIYARGFLPFFALSCLITVPGFGFQLALSYTGVTRAAGVVAVLMLSTLLVCWPIFIGGLQFATAEIGNGRRANLRETLRRAVNFWPRIARLCLFVYGSYLFWTVLPLLVIVTVAASPTILNLLLAALALGFQVFMTARLWVNFMFWQQACTIGQLDGAQALAESKELARSRRDLPVLQRPLYRGAIIASLWLLLFIVVSMAIEVPFMMVRLQGSATFEEAYAVVQSLMNARTPDTLMIVSNVLSSVAGAVMRPLLGIAFVLLYFDAKAKQ